jgi:hypothetical protein
MEPIVASGDQRARNPTKHEKARLRKAAERKAPDGEGFQLPDDHRRPAVISEEHASAINMAVNAVRVS